MVSKFPFYTESVKHVSLRTVSLSQADFVLTLSVRGWLSEMELEGIVEKPVLLQGKAVWVLAPAELQTKCASSVQSPDGTMLFLSASQSCCLRWSHGPIKVSSPSFCSGSSMLAPELIDGHCGNVSFPPCLHVDSLVLMMSLGSTEVAGIVRRVVSFLCSRSHSI